MVAQSCFGRMYGLAISLFSLSFPLCLEFYAISLRPRLIWQGCSSGKFSVKSIYNIASSSHSSVDETFKLIWQNVAPPRVQCFGWLSYLGKVKTAEFLFRLRIIHDEGEALCSFCNSELKTLNHLLLHCFLIWNCWAATLRWCGVVWCVMGSPCISR